MDITATVFDWPAATAFASAAGDDFQNQYWEMSEETEDNLAPWESALDEEDDSSDSFHGFQDAFEFLDPKVPADSPWRPFLELGFHALIDDPNPRNDLGVPCDPEMFASILSPDTLREALAPTAGTTPPWTGAPDHVEHEAARWHHVWTKAIARNQGLAYHLG